MKKILSIIKRNFKLIIRSRISALIILFGPLVIMLIVGLAFNSTAQLRINVGYYAPGETGLTNTFIGVLSQSNYNLRGFERYEDCRNEIGSGTIHICVIFPNDFELSNGKVNEVVFLVDNSKINLFESVVDSIESAFNQKAAEMTTGMTQDLLDKLNETQSSITNKSVLISELKQENIDLKNDVLKISKEVSDLDLDFDYGSMNIEDLDDATDDLSKSIKEIKNIAYDIIDESYDLIEELNNQIQDLNISSSTKSDLFDLLNETEDNIIDLEDDLNDTQKVNTSSLKENIDNLRDNLRDVDFKFTSAASARDVSVLNIKSINQKLNESQVKIYVLEETFNSIYSNIENTEIRNINSITNPITKRVEQIVTEENQLNFYFPYLIVLIIMFVGLLLSSTLIIIEKSSRAHFRNFVTPTSDLTFIFGTYFTTLIIMTIQMAVVLAIFSIYFQKDIFSNFKSIALVLLFLMTLFTWIGMVIGNLFNTEETGTLASISIGSTLLFISDLIFPLERMPDYIANIARTFNPFVIGTESLRKTIVHRITIDRIGNDLYLLIIYLIVIFILLVLSHKFMKRSYLLRWSGYVVRREIRKKEQTDALVNMLKTYENIEEKDYFVTKDGKKIGSLKDLKHFTEHIYEADLKHYVSENENLLADWVETVVKNINLAASLRKAKTKKKTVSVLEEGIKFYQKIKEQSIKESKKKKD